MKIFVAQLNYTIGDFEGNKSKIIDSIKEAKNQNCNLVVFSEMAVCGFSPKDLLLYQKFIEKCEQTIKQIAQHCEDISVLIGGISSDNKNLVYNSAFLIENGNVKIVSKKLIGDENVKTLDIIDIQGVKAAIVLGNIFDFHLDEKFEIKHDANLIINLYSAPFIYEYKIENIERFQLFAKSANLPIICCSQVGGNDSDIYHGDSLVVNPNSLIVSKCKSFEEDFSFVNFDKEKQEFSSAKKYLEKEESSISQIHKALVVGVRDYFKKSNLKKAIIGLSGGIDSAVTLVILSEALGAENVYGVLMPSEFSTKHSIDDAIESAKNLGCKYDIIPIKDNNHSILQSLEPFLKNTKRDVTEENIQARIRMVLLMALANKFGYVLLNTSNKSEAAVGYGTMYGDMCGAMSVLGDLYKTQVYELANYINKDKIVIPVNSIVKPPSAELSPNQKDSDSLPDYQILDKILYHFIEMGENAETIANKGIDKDIVEKVLKMVQRNEWKRLQAPPVIKISSRSMSDDRVIPATAKYQF